MASTENAIDPGFTNPVYDSQYIFKTILNSMAAPGTIQHITPLCEAPDTINPTTGAVCLTLFDSDTRVWLSDQSASLGNWLKFHCGCEIVHDQQKADFALIVKGSQLPDLESFSLGTPENPDKSTTIITEVESLETGSKYITQGPGIKDENSFSAQGLQLELVNHLMACKPLFPMGFDLIITAENSLASLTRTTTIRSL